MSGHHGYKASGRGDLPRATFTLELPSGEIAMRVALLAHEIKNAAIQLNISPRQVLKELREASIVDCSDEAAEAALALLGSQTPSPPISSRAEDS
jgi:hypothetical protein